MPDIRVISMPTEEAEALWAGGVDAYGVKPEVQVSDGNGVPCRHCQRDVAAGEEYLVLAYCPFPAPQPYAETGPIFVHARPCPRYPVSERIPAMLLKRKRFLLKGYSAEDRIVYGTGQIVRSADIGEAATAILARPEVAYVHARSALNNCFTCRIERA